MPSRVFVDRQTFFAQINFDFDAFLNADSLVMVEADVELKRKRWPGEEEDADEHNFSHSYEVRNAFTHQLIESSTHVHSSGGRPLC